MRSSPPMKKFKKYVSPKTPRVEDDSLYLQPHVQILGAIDSYDESTNLLLFDPITASGREPKFDIVAVHGLNGHKVKSWTHPSNDICWLKDFLPLDIEEANVYSYGYPPGNSIDSHARDLIRLLDDERSKRKSYEVPIAFVAHNLGGLIVKEALILLASFRESSQTRILTNTVSLLMFGVPHRAAFSTSFRYVWNLFAKLGTPRERRGGEDPFPSERELKVMIQEFARISNNYRIYTFCDMVPVYGGREAQLVEMNYYMGLPTEELLHINATHPLMTRFPTRNSDYQKVLAILRRTAFHHGIQNIPRSNDWQADQLFRLDGLESETGKQWFIDLESDAHRVVNSRTFSRSIRVAVIDSGIDAGHPSFEGPASEGQIITESFINDPKGDEDEDGHGTHTAHLVLKMAPRAKLFIARVYRHGTEEELNNVTAIVRAIRWAIKMKVNIISISLGYRRASEQIKEALRDAFHSSIIIFAAASNSGVNPRNPISFPANMRQVICIHSSDGNGNPSPHNPPTTPDCNFAILGEGVAAAWPRNLPNDRTDNLRVASGSSVATPIAAGLAALIMEYALQGGPATEVVTKSNRLKHCDEMRKLFGSIARDRDGYKSIVPSMLFDYHGEQMHQRVCGKITEVLDSL